MRTPKRIEEIIGTLLLCGTLLSALIVCVGGMLFLLQYGNLPMQIELTHATDYQLTLQKLSTTFALTPTYIIEIGLFCLVATQILRVALLVGFYAYQKDRWFTAISLFIFLVLIYSNVWLN